MSHLLDLISLHGQPHPLLELLNHLPDVAVFAKDHDGRFMMVNQHLVRAVDREHQDEVIGRLDSDFFPPNL
ncbi:MAG: PAS domain-containing protein [Planctomycetota bacterium]